MILVYYQGGRSSEKSREWLLMTNRLKRVFFKKTISAFYFGSIREKSFVKTPLTGDSTVVLFESRK